MPGATNAPTARWVTRRGRSSRRRELRKRSLEIKAAWAADYLESDDSRTYFTRVEETIVLDGVATIAEQYEVDGQSFIESIRSSTTFSGDSLLFSFDPLCVPLHLPNSNHHRGPHLCMEISDAQREVRSVYRNGVVGQTVSGLIWLLSASLGTWVSVRSGIIILAVGGMFIFPLTQFVLRLLGGPTTLQTENPLNGLAMQIAFMIPLTIPVIGAATLNNVNWFYPAFMVIVGAHYLPFVFLYGMQEYAILAAILIAGGVTIGYVLPNTFSSGGWFAAATLLLFGISVWRLR